MAETETTTPTPPAPTPAPPPATPPAKRPPPKMPTKTTAPAAAPAAKTAFTLERGVTRTSWKLGIYGPEGIGKSSLAALCPGIAFCDLELSTLDLDITRVKGVNTGDYVTSWANLRRWVQGLSSGIYAIDSVTRAEDWCAAWVVKNKKSNEGAAASDSLEDFRYKAGLTFVVDEFRRFLSDIENAFVRGASFVMLAHNRISRIKNPDGSDFIRNEPRLIDDPKASNMLQWVQFLDHLAFVDLDKAVNKQGKVSGSGSRTIFLDTAPNRISKTRSLPKDPMEFLEGSTTLWELLGVPAAE